MKVHSNLEIDIKEFQSILRRFLPDDDRPVVAYTSLWTIARAFPITNKDFPKVILDCLLDVVGQRRTLCMPTFTSGFQNGVIDLDRERGTTGLLNELLRLTSGSCRTASAFFSFACLGPQAEELAQLRPDDAWGDGSIYEWMEIHDAHCLMIGVQRTQCSYLHRLEWLRKELIPYRYIKTFIGKMIRDVHPEPLQERLFVRDRESGVLNTWESHVEHLKQFGLRSIFLGNGYITEMSAKAMKDALLPVVTQDPFAFVKNPDYYRHYYRNGAKSSQDLDLKICRPIP